jgi:signal transduction histidine kinase
MRLREWFAHPRRPAPPPGDSDRARLRRDRLAEAAVALVEAASAGPDNVLRVTVEAAARMTGAGAAVALAGDDGRLERLAAHRLDGCTRHTLARPDVLQGMIDRMHALCRPLAADDLDDPLARTLRAVAPHGLVVVPIDAGALLVLVASTQGGGDLDADGIAVVTLLARIVAAALRRERGQVALEQSRAELRRVCADVLERHEQQLSRTAGELHEGICQRLAAANAQLEALGAAVQGQREPLARLRDARGLLNQTLGELRELAQQLRPSVLQNLGYVEALRWYVGRLREREGLALALEVEGAETRLPEDVESALYRATEEALSVAGRSARRLRVRYRREPESVRIEIAGPPPDTVDLSAIRERLRPFGGGVSVDAAPGRPPVIAVHVPARVN